MVADFILGGLQNHCRWWLQPRNKKTLTPWKENYDPPRQHIRKQRHYFANKGPSCQGYGFSSSHVWMWELNHKETWALNNWCFWTVALEKTLESPLDWKEIQQIHPKDQSWIFIGRTYVKAETPILWPPDSKNWPIWQDPDAGKIEGGRRRGQQRMRWLDNERVIGRKARGLQTDEIGCKGQIFLCLLSDRRKQISVIFFPFYIQV